MVPIDDTRRDTDWAARSLDSCLAPEDIHTLLPDEADTIALETARDLSFANVELTPETLRQPTETGHILLIAHPDNPELLLKAWMRTRR